MKATIETSELRRLVKATAKFISKDDYRTMMQYVKLTFSKNDNSVQAAATDGYRLAIENAKCLDVDRNFSVLIKPYLPVGATGKHAVIELSKGRCLIDIDGRMVGYQQPEGKAWDSSELVQTIEKFPVIHEVYANRKYLRAALDSISPDEYAREPVGIQLREEYGAITITTKNGARYILPVRKNSRGQI